MSRKEETEITRLSYEWQRSQLANLMTKLIEANPSSREDVLTSLSVKDPYDITEGMRLMLLGLRVHRAIRILDKVAEIFTGDPLDWSDIPSLKVLDIGGGSDDLFTPEGKFNIRPNYPCLGAVVTALGAECTNIDLGSRPQELPEKFIHVQRDLLEDLSEQKLEIPGIERNSKDLITCLNFCDLDNADPHLRYGLKEKGRGLLNIYNEIKSYAAVTLVPGGILIIDGIDRGEIWMATDDHKLTALPIDHFYVGMY